MMKLYFKQAWEMLKQNKLFSALYIAGTGLAIAMTMAVFVAHYIKVAPIYPETNRGNTWVLKSVTVKVKPNGSTNWKSSYTMLRDWWYPIRSAEVVSGVYDTWDIEDYIQPSDAAEEVKVKVKYTDPAFFRVFDFAFLSGKPFTEADFNSGLYNAVIGKELAMKLFGSVDVVGKTFSLNYTDCRVAGVVRDASSLTLDSFGQLYLPYTTQVGYEKSWSQQADLTGGYTTYFKVKDAAQGEALDKEVKEMVRKYNASQDEKQLVLMGPDEFWQSAYRRGNRPLDFGALALQWLGLIAVFLLVPALNLSGMISTRMESRLPEMGVSKAFGASRGRLLRQVLGENLVLTCLGGFFGLCLAWSVLVLGRNWVFSLFASPYDNLGVDVDTIVSADMLFSPWLFVAAFAVCVLLNVLSALLPAWRSLKKDIVYSLNQKK